MYKQLVATVTTIGLSVTMAGALTRTAEAATLDPVTAGTSPATAAASCWEIKQLRPAVANGSYWLWTPSMGEPGEFYCDMTTDGGGWVLVGKGRSGWKDDHSGQRSGNLQSPNLSTMGHATSQHSADTIDALLNGARVDSLTDGIRMRRARNTAGTRWQEVRVKLANRSRWAWTFGAEHPVATWRTGGTSGSGGRTASFGTGQGYNRVRTSPIASQGYRSGFAYGTNVAGSSSSSSYLWSRTSGAGRAMPYTQVYLRPRTSSTVFAAVPNSGTAARSQPPVAKSRALDSPWGVGGTAGNTSVEGYVEVQAFTQSGNTMFVGGNFARVQRDVNGSGAVNQPFLAGFDVSTGELVTSFRPQLNEQVRALATLPDGSVVAGGLFTRANGQPAAHLVALDPVTGATRSGWQVTVENRVSSGKAPIVQALGVSGGWLYVGGRHTHLSGPDGRARWAKNLGRVRVADGNAGANWNGRLNGTVNDVDVAADGSRVFVAGFFGKSGGVPARRAAVLSTELGAELSPQFTPTWSATRDYQRAVEEVGNRVYFGGSEHSLFGFDTANMQRVSGSITKRHGDIQAVDADSKGVLYAGCHCQHYTYENAYTWRTLNPDWTQADPIQWVGAWDAATGRQIPHFLPTFATRRGSGVWAIETDSRGNLWVGGDITTATTKQGARRGAGGFVRFDPSDATPPPTPGNVSVSDQTADTVTLTWQTVSDAGGGVRYQVFRDDRVVGFTSNNAGSLTLPKGGNNRFFVRATDRAGNLSASSPVVTP